MSNGNYNHGQIKIDGITHVPYVLNFNINPHKPSILINYYNNTNDFFEDHYYDEDLENVLVPEALNKEDVGIDYDAFITVVKSGKNPIIKGAKTKRELLTEELEKESESEKIITRLDLSGKK